MGLEAMESNENEETLKEFVPDKSQKSEDLKHSQTQDLIEKPTVGQFQHKWINDFNPHVFDFDAIWCKGLLMPVNLLVQILAPYDLYFLRYEVKSIGGQVSKKKLSFFLGLVIFSNMDTLYIFIIYKALEL